MKKSVPANEEMTFPANEEITVRSALWTQSPNPCDINPRPSTQEDYVTPKTLKAQPTPWSKQVLLLFFFVILGLELSVTKVYEP
jgi:hypothetical protein